MRRVGKSYEDAIFSIVCDHHGVAKEHIIDPLISRNSREVMIRHTIMYFLSKSTHLTLETIGSYFGRNHASVINARTKIQNRIDTEKLFRAEIQKLTEEIENEFKEIDVKKAIEHDEMKKKAIEEGKKSYTIGRCKVEVSVDFNKWHMVISTPKAPPSISEVKKAIHISIPQNITMELLIPRKDTNKNQFTIHLWEKV